MPKWRILGAGACTLALSALALAGPAVANETALAIGSKAADFRLVDQNGEPRELREFTARGRTVLLFFRSADW